MDDQDLQNLLQKLHDEIERTRNVDETGRELLRHLSADINDLLTRSAGEQKQLEPSMVRQVEDAIDHFEVSHPVLTALLSELSSILSNAGI